MKAPSLVKYVSVRLIVDSKNIRKREAHMKVRSDSNTDVDWKQKSKTVTCHECSSIHELLRSRITLLSSLHYPLPQHYLFISLCTYPVVLCIPHDRRDEPFQGNRNLRQRTIYIQCNWNQSITVRSLSLFRFREGTLECVCGGGGGGRFSRS